VAWSLFFFSTFSCFTPKYSHFLMAGSGIGPHILTLQIKWVFLQDGSETDCEAKAGEFVKDAVKGATFQLVGKSDSGKLQLKDDDVHPQEEAGKVTERTAGHVRPLSAEEQHTFLRAKETLPETPDSSCGTCGSDPCFCEAMAVADAADAVKGAVAAEDAVTEK
jgi:hypothetical protein